MALIILICFGFLMIFFHSRVGTTVQRKIIKKLEFISMLYHRAWTNEKCLGTKHHQTLFGDQTLYRLDTLFGAVCFCLLVLNRAWSCLTTFEGHQTFDHKLK